MKTRKSDYEIGDIVFVSKYNYSNGSPGQNHLFVVIDVDKNELVPVEYFGMLVSSHRDKCKDNFEYEYNEPLDKNSLNGLNDDSIVKCDEVYSIPPQNIMFKIGSVDVDDYLRFMKAYNKLLSSLEEGLSN